jgi:hypothetical protein
MIRKATFSISIKNLHSQMAYQPAYKEESQAYCQVLAVEFSWRAEGQEGGLQPLLYLNSLIIFLW